MPVMTGLRGVRDCCCAPAPPGLLNEEGMHSLQQQQLVLQRALLAMQLQLFNYLVNNRGNSHGFDRAQPSVF